MHALARSLSALTSAAGVVLLAVVALVAAQLAPAGDIWRQTAVAFAAAGMLATARRRVVGQGPVFFDDFLRDLLIYLGVGLFAGVCIFAAERLIGGRVSPGWPAIAVFLVGPSDCSRRRRWGVRE